MSVGSEEGEEDSYTGTGTGSALIGKDEDEDEDEDEDFEDWAEEELSEEDEARVIFNELRGASPGPFVLEGENEQEKPLTLVNFLRWDDVQELLECGALTKDNLAQAIENVGVAEGQDSLGFQAFFDLVRKRKKNVILLSFRDRQTDRQTGRQRIDRLCYMFMC